MSATAALATVVGAVPVSATGSPAVVHAGSSTSAVRAAVPERPGGAAHEDVTSALPPVDQGAGRQLTQVVLLNVRGGALELADEHQGVALARVPGSDSDWVGLMPPVRVVDARGTLEGWSVRWHVTGIHLQGSDGANNLPDAKVHLDPGDPTVIDGGSDGLVAGKGGPAARMGRVLFGSDPGSGGGTYEADGTLSMRLPRNLSVDGVTVELAFTVS